MDTKGSEIEAKEKCNELSSTLITIGSLSEQKFFENLVQKHNTLSDRVWIGLEWIDNTFKWIDGSDVKGFDNWDKNADKKGDNKCVQMAIKGSDIGKWSDDECNTKYLMACEKKQNNGNDMQQQINSLNKIVNTLSLEVIPIGFLYTQLPEQSSPQQLWPSLQWTEVTKQYAGYFLRAEGNGSLPFGQTQQDNAPHLLEIKYHYKDNYDSLEGKTITLKPNDWTDMMSGDMYVPSDHKLMHWNMHMSGGEVRPKNVAIKMWKRTK